MQGQASEVDHRAPQQLLVATTVLAGTVAIRCYKHQFCEADVAAPSSEENTSSCAGPDVLGNQWLSKTRRWRLLGRGGSSAEVFSLDSPISAQ